MPPVHQPRGANTSVGLVVNLEITKLHVQLLPFAVNQPLESVVLLQAAPICGPQMCSNNIRWAQWGVFWWLQIFVLGGSKREN